MKVNGVLGTEGVWGRDHLWNEGIIIRRSIGDIDTTDLDQEIDCGKEVEDELPQKSSRCVSRSRVHALLRRVLDTGNQRALACNGN